MTKRVFFGVVEAIPKTDDMNILDGGKGAFINTLALATSPQEFVCIVTDTLAREYDLAVIAIEDLYILDSVKDNMKKKWHNFAKKLNADNPIYFSEFQIYMNE